MKIRSLSLRLLVLAIVTTFMALAATGAVLNNLFQNYFKERVFSELETHLNQLTANLIVGENGELQVSSMSDSRFAMPFSGLYWQAQSGPEEAGDVTRELSRSLWGAPLHITHPDKLGTYERSLAISPHGESLLALSWSLTLGDGGDQRTVLLSVATNENSLTRVSDQFRRNLLTWLAFMFLFLVVAAWIQVKLGLQPLEALRGHIQEIRAGRAGKLPEEYPKEVQPLAAEVNTLLKLHQDSLSDARAHASDLAHGLKTPLSVLRILAQELRTQEEAATADEMEDQINAMNHYVERELARARTNAAPASGCDAIPVIKKLLHVMQKLPTNRSLQWTTKLPDRLIMPIDEHDLSELLGNILDNAQKWANTQVIISHEELSDNRNVLRVQDDGAGVPENMLGAIFDRGQRLDPTVRGSGLGLAICRDIAETHRLNLELSKSDLGGLMVSIEWNGAVGRDRIV